jgi:GTPase SAR1 family protein
MNQGPKPTRISAIDPLPSAYTIKYPGLSPMAQEIHGLSEDLPKRWAAFAYKHSMPYLWVVFVGGTGTGKSTLFNAFCGRPLSMTGVERPKTIGPIAYAHQACPIDKGFPFPSIQIEGHNSKGAQFHTSSGTPGHLVVLEHDDEVLSHLVLVDTPDIDSVDAENRQITEDLYSLSDAVVFLASQEKYADEVPYKFLVRVMEARKPYFFILNKADQQLSQEDVLDTLQSQERRFKKERIWLIPYSPAHPMEQIADDKGFRDFVLTLMRELSKEAMGDLLQIELSGRRKALKRRLGRLLDLLDQEERAADNWLTQLNALYEDVSSQLIATEKERFSEQSVQYLRGEIRKLFSKYDVLARPRRFIRGIILTPFRLLGFGRQGTPKAHKKELLKVGRKVDLAPIRGATERFNRMVLERLSPADENAPLYKAMRQSHIPLNEKEIRDRIWEAQERLAIWLEETFQRLAKDFPTSKKWGIYSTSILWGVLILAFETAVGGGFTVLDAALDSALAPFVTKGAVELFAYHEIQKIAQELAKRYQDGLLTVLQEERDRYEQCLKSLTTSPETLESLRGLHSEMEG